LADVASALEARGFAGEIWDAEWRLVYLSSEYRTLVSGGRRSAEVPGIGEHTLSTAMVEARERWPTGPTAASFKEAARGWVGYVIATTAGGRDALLEVADPSFAGIIADATPEPPPAAWAARADVKFGNETIGNDVLITTVHDADGRRAGYLGLVKPEVRAAVLGMLALGDVRLFERMSRLLEPARRPAAILFADIEASTALSRTLSTSSYFRLVRRFVLRSDRAVVEAGGVVGKHVGDGVTAFFLVEDGRSESATVRACVETMRAIRTAARESARRSDLSDDALVIRFGLHWGATLYVGRLMTSGRAEVTALGDEVNEAARIEACASGGRALASKALVERLDASDAADLGVDPDDVSYTPLASLPTAVEKARRDAPAIAVCEL
jgi:class 3 adenylate cyclase